MSQQTRDDVDVEVLARAFAPLDRAALGLATGLVFGAGLFLATAILLLQAEDGDRIGPTLSLLGHYFPGYRASWPGAGLGFLYGGAAGFLAGWVFAAVKNVFTLVSLRQVRLKAEREQAGGHFLDHV